MRSRRATNDRVAAGATTTAVAVLRVGLVTLSLMGCMGCQQILGIGDPLPALVDGGGGSSGGDASVRAGAGGTSGGASGGRGGSAGEAGSGGTSASGGAGGSANWGGATSGGAGGNAGAAGAGGAAFSCSGTVYCTDFSSGSASDWTPTGGVWKVQFDPAGIHGQVYSGGGGSFISSLGTKTWTDQSIEAKVYVDRFGSTTGSSYRAGVVARYANSSAFYTLSIDADGYLRLLRGTNGVSGTGTCGPVLSTLASPTQTWMTMKLSVAGATTVTLKTWLDGVAVHDCATTSVVTSGSAGVITYGTGTIADFDEVRVTSP